MYEKRIAALEYLLDNDATFQQVPDWDYDSIAIAKDKVTAEDKIEAFKFDLFFIEEGEGDTVRLARYRLVLAINIPRPNDPKTRLALESLGVDPGYGRYVSGRLSTPLRESSAPPISGLHRGQWRM